MRKVGILVIIGLLAITGVMAAMAYTSATVTNEADLTVIRTNSALLRLERTGGVGNKDEAAYYQDGMLKFDFSKGKDGKTFGVQPGSVYEWGRLVRIQNNSNDNVRFTIKNNGLPEYVTVVTDHSNYKHTLIDKGVDTGHMVPLYANSADGFPYYNMWIKVIIDVPEGENLESFGGELIVEAEAF
ncbi:MAG: hypothetical protein ACOX6X_04115 [Dethiobacteria bacterium]|jgi:hypothetical protein